MYWTWLANFLVLFGSYNVGQKRRYGFLLQLTGNVIWAWVGYSKGMADLSALTLAFVFLYAWNWRRWGQLERDFSNRDC